MKKAMAKKIDYANLFTLRKDGRYQAVVPNACGGKPQYIYDRDPEVLFNKVEAALKPKTPSFTDIAEAWHDKHWEVIKDGTKASYTAMYNRAVEAHEDINAIDVSAADICKHLQKLADKKMSGKSIKTLRTIYKLIYQNAITDDYYGKFITNNPALNVPLPSKIKPATKREAPEDEIIDKIRTSAGSAYFGLFPMLLISTGFRRGEALALTWGDIDFKNKVISCNKSLIYRGTSKIGETKTAAGKRTVPLLTDLARILKKPKGAQNTDYVFPSESGSYLPQAAYNRHWKHYCKDMGFVSISKSEERTSSQGKKYTYYEFKNTLTAHTLRHGYATMLYDAGVDVYTAQKLLGHANIETTMAVYTHLSQRKQQQSLKKLNEYVANNYKPVVSKKMSKKPKHVDNA